MSNFYTSVIS